MIRFGSKEDWVTMQVGAVLPEDVQAKGWRFSLLPKAREVFGNLLGERAWAPMDWSEFGSKVRSEIRSELGLGLRFGFELTPERGVVGLPKTETDSDSKINSLRSEMI